MAEEKQGASVPEQPEEEKGRLRRYKGVMAWVVMALSAFMPLYCIFYILNISGYYLNTLFYSGSFRAGFLGLVLTLVFLLFPATKKAPRRRLPRYDLLLILIAWVPTLYEFIIYPQVGQGLRHGATLMEQMMFVTLVVVLCEAIRRTLGLVIVGVVAAFILYAKFAYLLPGLWGAPSFSLERLTEYMYLYDVGIFGSILAIAATLVIVFITFGSFLTVAGVSKLLTDAAFAVAGRFRGGPAKVAIVASAMFATISGSPSANAASIGTMTIPLMKKYGYKDYFAGAIESVASTGGIITPPVMGSVAFIIAETTGLGYRAVALAAILPAILYYVCLYFQVDFEAAKLKLMGVPRSELPSLRKVLWQRGYLALSPLLLAALMIIGLDVKEAALWAIVAAIIVSWFKRETRIGLKKIVEALAGGGQGILWIAPVMAGAGIMVGAVTLSGLMINLGALIKGLAGGNLWLLGILTWIAVYLSGLPLGEIIIFIVMSIIVLPAFISLGVPQLAGAMFIFYVGTASFLTPPNAPPVFVSCAIAGSGLWRTGFQAMRLGIISFLVPFLLLFDPAFILMGSPVHIVVAMVSAIVGALFLAAGIEGYLLTEASWWQRILFAIGGLGLFIPGTGTDLLGLVILIPGIVQFRVWRASKQRLAALSGLGSARLSAENTKKGANPS